MSPTEQGIRREQRLKDDLAARKRQLAQVQAQNRAQARKDLTRRRLCVGALADEAGLLVLDDVTLARLFRLLSPLTQLPRPDAVLESLLAADVRAWPAASTEELWTGADTTAVLR